jgi:hypothetical protein
MSFLYNIVLWVVADSEPGCHPPLGEKLHNLMSLHYLNNIILNYYILKIPVFYLSINLIF